MLPMSLLCIAWKAKSNLCAALNVSLGRLCSDFGNIFFKPKITFNFQKLFLTYCAHFKTKALIRRPFLVKNVAAIKIVRVTFKPKSIYSPFRIISRRNVIFVFRQLISL